MHLVFYGIVVEVVHNITAVSYSIDQFKYLVLINCGEK